MPEQPPKTACEICGGMHPTSAHPQPTKGEHEEREGDMRLKHSDDELVNNFFSEIEQQKLNKREREIIDQFREFLNNGSGNPDVFIQRLYDLNPKRKDYERISELLERLALNKISLLESTQVQLRGDFLISNNPDETPDSLAKLGVRGRCAVHNKPYILQSENDQIAMLGALLMEIRARASAAAGKEAREYKQVSNEYSYPVIVYAFSKEFEAEFGAPRYQGSPAPLKPGSRLFAGHTDDVGVSLRGARVLPVPQAFEESLGVTDKRKILFPKVPMVPPGTKLDFKITKEDRQRRDKFSTAMHGPVETWQGQREWYAGNDLMQILRIETYSHLLLFANKILTDLQNFEKETGQEIPKNEM